MFSLELCDAAGSGEVPLCGEGDGAAAHDSVSDAGEGSSSGV